MSSSRAGSAADRWARCETLRRRHRPTARTTVDAIVDRRVRSVGRRWLLKMTADLEHVQDAEDHLAISDPRLAGLAKSAVRFNSPPRCIRARTAAPSSLPNLY